MEEMEMPTPCERCLNWFDLHNGRPSKDGRIQICKSCSIAENE